MNQILYPLVIVKVIDIFSDVLPAKSYLDICHMLTGGGLVSSFVRQACYLGMCGNLSEGIL